MALQLGANAEARLAKAVQTLTFRPLAFMPPPEEDVILESVSLDGRRRKMRLEWRVAEMSYLTRRFAPIFQVEKEENNFSNESFQARVVKTSFGDFRLYSSRFFPRAPRCFFEAFCRSPRIPARRRIDLGFARLRGRHYFYSRTTAPAFHSGKDRASVVSVQDDRPRSANY